jgi:hypothetical protein
MYAAQAFETKQPDLRQLECVRYSRGRWESRPASTRKPILSAKPAQFDPQRYMTQLLTNLPATPISQMEQWLPD